MRSVEQRVAAWLPVVTDLLFSSLDELPHEVIFDQLQRTFAVGAVSYTWADARGVGGDLMSPADALAPMHDLMEVWHQGEQWRDCHPLTTWYAVTGDLRPTTMARVPTALVPRRKRSVVVAQLRPLGLEEQLSITCTVGGDAYKTYVLARTSHDFDDDDLAVAARIQQTLIGIDRQVGLLRGLRERRGRQALCPEDLGLTGRETAVLILIAAGHPTRVVAQHLGCSPATVSKHLERLYPKLGVHDRLNAVRVARSEGLI